MSYSCLIADANHAQACTKELLDQVVLFVVQRSAAKMGDGLGIHHGVPILVFDKGLISALPDAIDDHIHRGLEIEIFPAGGIGAAAFDFL